MPKKPITNDEAIVSLYRELTRTLDPKDLKAADDLQGDDLKNFRKFCHTTFNNPYFDRIIKGFIFAQCMLTAEKGITADHYWNGKLTVNGVKALEEYIARQASLFEQMMQQEPGFDPQASFSPAKV